MCAVGWVGDADSLLGNALTWVGTVSGLLEGAANSTVANAVAYIGSVSTAFTGWTGAMSTGIGTFADRIINENTEGGDGHNGTLAYQQDAAGAPPAGGQNEGSGASYEDNSEWWDRASGWHPGTWWGIRDLINWGAGYDPEAAAYMRTPIIRTGNVDGAGLPISGKFTLGSRGTYWGTTYSDAGQQASTLVTSMASETSGQTAVNVAMAAAGMSLPNGGGSIQTGRWTQLGPNGAVRDLLYHFERHGADVGARDVAQYLRKAEEFSRNL